MRRVIASLMMCLLLAGTTLASADSDRDRGDRRQDRGSKSEKQSKETKRSKEQSRDQRTLRSGERREGYTTERREVRQPSRVERERSMTRGDNRPPALPYREQYRVERERREVAQGRREPTRQRESWRSQHARASERVVSRTPTPAGWHNRAVRGRAQYTVWDDHRATRWRTEHRRWRDRGGYQGYWIPEDRYWNVCGPSRRFRVDRCPLVIVGGYPRFHYGGYWVTFIDPWPEYWDDDWYAYDECYITYIDDGYYLTNVHHPQVRIAVSFTIG